MTEWMAESRRNLFFDFHTHSSATSVLSEFDAAAWARTLGTMDVETVSVFAVDAFGWRYYRDGDLGWIHPQLPPGRDLVRETVDACRDAGIKTIAYFNTMNSEPVAAHHPEWLEVDADGVPKNDYDIYQEMVVCWLGSAVETLFIPQITELARNYQLDGLFFDGTYAHSPCYCDDCRRNYSDFAGRDIPVDASDDGWREWVEWAEGIWISTRRRIIDAIKGVSPHTSVCFNWGYTTRRPEPVPDGIGFLSLDLFPQNQSRDSSYQSKWWASSGTPFAIMNTAFVGWWGDWGLKPLTALTQEIGVALAHGGTSWLGYQLEPSHTLRPGVRETLTDFLAFIRAREDQLPRPNELIADVAALHATDIFRTRPMEEFTDETLADQFPVGTYQLGKPFIFADETSLRGVHQAVLRGGLTSQFANEHYLEEHLQEFRVVVLADQRHVPDALVTALRSWVERGGKLFVTHKTGTLDKDLREQRSRVLEELAGVESVGDSEYPMSYIEPSTRHEFWAGLPDLPILCRTPALHVTATAADTVCALRNMYVRGDGAALLRTSPPGELTEYPSVTTRRLGEGTVVYSAIDTFSAASRANQWMLDQLNSTILHSLLGEPLITVMTPGWEVTAHRRGDYFFVHSAYTEVPSPPQRTQAYSSQAQERDFEIRISDAAVHVEPGAAVELLPAGEATLTREGSAWVVRGRTSEPMFSVRLPARARV